MYREYDKLQCRLTFNRVLNNRSVQFMFACLMSTRVLDVRSSFYLWLGLESNTWIFDSSGDAVYVIFTW